MSDRVQQLYQEILLEHNKQPRNFHEIKEANAYSHGVNPLCGDDYQLFLKINDKNIIEDLGFTGNGCAISKSSASLMSTVIKGKTLEEAEKLKDCFHELLTQEEVSQKTLDTLGKLKIFQGVKQFPVRVKCATLIWHALEDALQDRRNINEKKEKSISTE
ncbi:MAG: SUF system NifU family Fe-S cluster assembly protein [Deltaproteobacteria bacterium CG_4_10_14_0_2_um_filter_43_8]|nr:MAG: SUF system NifU family Fe-S cluster assembly protein [Deltaproteobacteria bacterium CG11_big_fil_rev_8_21_14_0_20_42_23]PJA20364.1 MAG: SUF system NifU family Fe-S cluster assembly protein [Deltaproteobacteria bacterium CG_4_10_14_0_2_um_filter_43_8]PJC64150.1 MAG: SUF system NifU family Fe-S cluster assembly protein [Deltaproteobacteria bacterium CG_4_9_14_0_2_um_filter_42_21]